MNANSADTYDVSRSLEQDKEEKINDELMAVAKHLHSLCKEHGLDSVVMEVESFGVVTLMAEKSMETVAKGGGGVSAMWALRTLEGELRKRKGKDA